MSGYQLQWRWKDIVEDRHRPLVDSRDRFLVLENTVELVDVMVKKFVFRCLSEPRFMLFLVSDDRMSQFNAVTKVIDQMKLDHLFITEPGRQEIACINGNRIVGFDVRESGRFYKSKFPCGAWYEDPALKDIETVSALMKDKRSSYNQEVIMVSEHLEEVQRFLVEKFKY